MVHVISTPSGFGGAERVLQQLVKDQAGRGEAVTVVNPFCRDERDVAAARDYYAPARFEGRTMRSATQVVTVRSSVAALISQIQPNILHSHLFHAAVLTSSVRSRGAVRLLTHHHGPLMRWRGDRGRDLLDRWATRRSDIVVAVSADVRDHVVGHCAVPQSRVRTIHNGWSGEVRSHRGSPTRLHLTCVANLRPEKGHEVLLRAMADVLAAEPEAMLSIVGDGPLRAELEALAGNLGISDAVRFEGHVTDVWAALAVTDVFVSAAHQEPLGIAVLEAMAAGVPVVATAVGGVPEIAPPGTAVLIPPGRPQQLADALLAVVRSPSTQSQLRSAGRGAAALWTAEAMVRAYADLYDELDPPGTRGC